MKTKITTSQKFLATSKSTFNSMMMIAVLFILCLFNLNKAKASDYYWVGGTGNWSDYANHWATASGGVIFHTTIPSPLDDVYFDGNSFTANDSLVKTDSTLIYCNNMNWTGATNNPIIKNSGVSTTLKIYGSLTLSSGMTLIISTLEFMSTSTGNTITSSGVVMESSISFDGINGGWSLVDALSITGSFSLSEGSFVTNNQTINCDHFIAFNIFLDLGTSNIYCYQWWAHSAATLTLNAASSFIHCNSYINGGGNQTYGDVSCGEINDDYNTYHDVTLSAIYGDHNIIHNASFSNYGVIHGSNNFMNKAVFADETSIDHSNTFDTLIFNNPGHVVTLKDTIFVNNALIANGACSGLITIVSATPGTQANIKKTSGNVILNYVLMQDIKAIGGANFTANNSVNAGNVTGWTINSPSAQNLYWVGGTGNWSDVNHWATSSGGAGGSCLPTPFDNVFFDANSFPTANDSVYADLSIIYCNNMNWTGATNNPIIKNSGVSTTLKIYGSLTLSSGMTLIISTLEFMSTSTGNTITSSGVVMESSISFDGINGGWSLVDALSITGSFSLSEGSFVTNNQTINCDHFIAFNIFLDLGTSNIYCYQWWAHSAATLTLNAASSFIHCNSYINGGGNQTYGDVSCGEINDDYNTYHDVTLSAIYGDHNIIHNASFSNYGVIHGSNNFMNKAVFADETSIDHSNTFDTLIFNNPGHVVTLKDTIFVNNALIANGACSGLITIVSATPGTQANIKKTSGNVILNYVLMQDIKAIGGANFTANNSVNAGNVTGWTINSPSAQNLYWVGGTGNWSDVNHWATSSGGAGGSCLPTPFDNVFFDANSFPTANDSVYADLSIIYCNNMNWTGATNNPIIKNSGVSTTLKIYGSLTLSSGMTLIISTLEFMSTSTGNTITSSGVVMESSISFDGINGGWSLVDALSITGSFSLSEGSFVTNNQTINCDHFIAFNIFLDLGTSNIYCYQWWAHSAATLTLNAASSFIHCNSYINGGGNQTYGDVSCGEINDDYNTYHDVTLSAIYGDHNIIHNASFSNYGVIHGSNNFMNKAVFADGALIDHSNSFDTLIFNNPGDIVTLKDTIFVNNALWTTGLPGFPTSIQSINAGTQAFISVPTGDTVCLEYLYLQDISAIGGGVFYAGDYSIDLGNNSGWLWDACSPDTSNVWPGDANYDLTADNIDVLYIGLAYGYTGATRAGATTNWVAQPAVDWLQQFANGTNIKHADCDGNGTINAGDTLAVSLNYGLTHPFKNPTLPLPNNFGTDLYFDMPPGALTPGTIVSIPIKFGTSIFPASNIYGIGFTVNYDAALIQAGSMQIDFSNSWLGTSGNTIHLTKDFPLNGNIDMGYVKTDHLNSNGNGTIATLTFTVANNAAGYLFLSFSDILVLDRNEFPVPVNAQTAVIYTSIDEHPSIESMINVYPNPASTSISITDANHIIQHVKLVDITGRIIVAEQSFDGVLQLDVSKVMKGMYMLSIQTTNGILNKRIQIVR